MTEDEAFKIDKTLMVSRFDRAAKSYERYSEIQSIIGERLFERLEFMSIEPRLVLDLGCGTGRLTEALQTRYKKAKVTGIDLSKEMIAIAEARRGWLSRHKYLCANAETLPFDDASIDLVFSNLMLPWFENPDALLKECRRVLKPGGLILFSSLGPDTLKEMRAAWAAADDAVHVNRFMDMHDIGDSLTKNRYFGVVMDTETITMTYESLSELHADLKGTGTQNANAGRRKSLLPKGIYRAYQEAYAGQKLPDGHYPASFEVVYGHAWCPKATDNMREKGPTVGRFNPGELIDVKNSDS